MLVDGVPTPRRERVWRRVIASLRDCAYEVAARASAPTSGPNDGAIEVVAVFSDHSENQATLEAMWADAVTAEEGK